MLANINAVIGEVTTVDWSECDRVESVAGKVGGKPVIKGTRIAADTVLIDEELGASAEETHESFPRISLETIGIIRAYGRSYKSDYALATMMVIFLMFQP